MGVKKVTFEFYFLLSGQAGSWGTKTTSDGKILADSRFWRTKTTSDGQILAEIASQGPRSIILRFLREPKVKILSVYFARHFLFTFSEPGTFL